MAEVWIPPLLRDLTGGVEAVRVPGATVKELVLSLDAAHPGVRARLCDGDSLRPGLAVIVDGLAAPLGLRQSVRPDSEVHFLPAIGGGSRRGFAVDGRLGKQFRPRRGGDGDHGGVFELPFEGDFFYDSIENLRFVIAGRG